MTPTAKKYKKQAMEAKETLCQMKIEKARRIAKEKQNWSAIVYCENCMEVSSVLIPPQNIKTKNLSCTVCRVNGFLHLIRKINCNRKQ